MRICKKCGNIRKPKYCKTCKRNYYINNKERIDNKNRIRINKNYAKIQYQNKMRYIRKRESLIEKEALRYNKNKDRIIAARYGLTEEEYKYLKQKQNNSCGICGKQQDRVLDVDHNHDTGYVRGLLCNKCNRGLGLFGDNIQNLAHAIIYINNFYDKKVGNVIDRNMCRRCEKRNIEFKTNHYICKECHHGNKKPIVRSRTLIDYNITEKQYLYLLSISNNRCQICQNNKNILCVDHCHKRKIARGILCKNCNTALGFFNEDYNLFIKAIEYLKGELYAS